MKWIHLSRNNAEDVEKQTLEIAELYRVLFLQLKLEKQQEIHNLLKHPKEFEKPKIQTTNVDKIGILHKLTIAIKERIQEIDEVRKQNIPQGMSSLLTQYFRV